MEARNNPPRMGSFRFDFQQTSSSYRSHASTLKNRAVPFGSNELIASPEFEAPWASYRRTKYTLEEIRASVIRRNQQRQNVYEHLQVVDPEDEASLSDIDDHRTEDISLISRTHGRQRRTQRNIKREELQAAIKYGTKEVANPGRDGSRRWKYTHDGVVFITDETSRHEVTSWRLDEEDDDEDE